MPGITRLTMRDHWHTPVVAFNKPERPKIFNTLKTAFLYPCFGKCAVQAAKPDNKANSRTREDSQATARPILVESQPGPSTSQQGDILSQLPGVCRFSASLESLTDFEDDNISVISLGEARKIAQLRIDGVGIQNQYLSNLGGADLPGPSTLSPKKTLPPIAGAVLPSNESPKKALPPIEGALPTSTASPKKTLPPIEPVYKKKAVSALKRVVKKNQTKGDNTVGLSKTQKKKHDKAAKKAAQEEKQRIKKSKKREKLTKRLEKKKKKVAPSAMATPSSSTQENGSNSLSIANEHAKIAELHKSISIKEKERNEKQQRVSQLMTRMEKEGSDWKSELTKLINSLEKMDKSISEMRAEVVEGENRIKTLTSTNRSEQESSTSQAAVNQPSSSRGSDSFEVGKLNKAKITRCPKSKVFKTNTSAPHAKILPPARPSTAVRRFSFTPDMTAVNYERNRLVREMLKVEEYAREQMFQRPLGAHHSRVRSVRENVQEFLPYELEHFDSDSDDEINLPRRLPTRRVADPESEGMRKFEESQRCKTRQGKKAVKKTVRFEDDGFEFEGEEQRSDRPINLNFYRQ